MEVILIIISLSIIGFVIYQSSPKIKFQKGISLYNSGNFKEAINVFDSVFYKHPDAPAKLAECKLKEGLNIKLKNESDSLKLFSEIIDAKKRLNANSNKKLFESVEAKALFEIADINYNNLSKINNLENKVKEIKENLIFIENSTKEGIESDFNKLKLKHYADLSDINFKLGSQKEKSDEFDDAQQHYSTAKYYASKSSNLKIIHNTITRSGICSLKKKQHDFFLDEIQVNISKAPVEYQREFYYRYAIQLIKEDNNTLADKIISTNLNFPSPAIEKLQNVIKNRKLVNIKKKIDEINFDLDKLYQNSFPVSDVKLFYEDLDKRIVEISSVIPALSDKLQQIKPSLFNRLLIHHISEEQYLDAIILIQKFPSYWESYELLKNLGFCCYGYTAQGNLTEKNYRTIISSWLTAVFSDKVILKSLEDTNWDDEYTFTLSEAIGSNYSQHSELPVNVNYEDSTETNISIGATQKELLTQYEALLSEYILEESLSKKFNEFYNSEKEAIEQIISAITTDILFSAPYFAKLNNINDSIMKVLNNDYDLYEDEKSLEAGIRYLKGNSEGAVSEYATAKGSVRLIISDIKNEDLTHLKSVASNSIKSLVHKYKTIEASIEDSIYNAFTAKIEENDENEDLFNLMELCIQFSEHNEKLKFQFSNYLVNYSVAKVNSDEIDNYKALSLIRKAYIYSIDNDRICKNFITLIRYNLLDILNDRTNNSSEIYKLLDEVYSNRSEILKNSCQELIKSRDEILTDLKAQGVAINLLTNEDPNSFVQSYIDHDLTSEGRKLKKVLSYMKKFSE